MLIFGHRSSNIHTEKISASCVHCGQINSINLTVFSKYAHLFWIPVFPLNKKIVSTCNHCKQTLTAKEMPVSYLNESARVKQAARRPIWQFAGLALIIVLFIIGLVNASKRSSNTKTYLADLHAGDIIEVKTGFRDYTLYKVTRVKTDSVFYLLSNYEVNRQRKLDEILEKADAFSEIESGTTKSELQDQSGKGRIVNVRRE